MTNTTPLPISQIATNHQLSAVRFSGCGKFLAATGRDSTIRLWDARPLETIPAEPAPEANKKNAKSAKINIALPELPILSELNGWATSLVFHPTESMFFASDSWGCLAAWQVFAEGAVLFWKVAAAHEGWLRQLALSTDGSQLASCGNDGKIRLWNVADGSRQQEFSAGEDIFSLAYHPEGKFLVSGNLRGKVQQWDLAESKSVRELDASLLYMLSFIQDVGGVRALAFDQAGTTLAAGGIQPSGGGFVQGSPVIRCFDWTSGKETRTLQLGDNTEGFVHELLFHANGYWLGVCSGQPGKGKYFLWNPGEEKPFFSSQGLANCHSLALNPAGDRLAVIANEGTFGQRKSQAREGIYPGNTSPIHIFALAEQA
jgi:WD40 repeat protein